MNSQYKLDQFDIIDQGIWQMQKERKFYEIDWSAFSKT